MAFRDFRDFLDSLERNGLLIRVTREIDVRFEIAAGVNRDLPYQLTLLHSCYLSVKKGRFF